MVCSMDEAAEMTARHREALTVLAARALELACEVQERAMAAETDSGMAELGLAFHRISRTVRQCLALEAKLARDAEQAVRAARADAARDRGEAVKERRRRLRAVLSREINEADVAAEDDDDWDPAGALTRTERLDALLDEDELNEDFLARPVGEQIARLREDLGLAEAALAAEPLASAAGQGAPWPGMGPRPADAGPPAWGGEPWAAGAPNSS